jgi:hypothetical protein
LSGRSLHILAEPRSIDASEERRRRDFFIVEHIEDVLQREMLPRMLRLHLLQGALDVVAHLPRPEGRFIGFAITFPPFLYPGLGFDGGAD